MAGIRASLALLAVLGGCAAPGVGPRFPSSSLGDRAAVDLAEVVVSVRTDEGTKNLHVWFSVLITPTRAVSEVQLAEVAGVMRRSEGRIAAQATEELVTRVTIPVGSLGDVRRDLVRVAQGILDQAISRWQLRDRFRFEAAVTSLYFTDGFVGRKRVAPRWW